MFRYTCDSTKEHRTTNSIITNNSLRMRFVIEIIPKTGKHKWRNPHHKSNKDSSAKLFIIK